MGGDLCVARRGVDPAVAEQHLDDTRIGAAFEKMGSEAMAERVGGDAVGDAGVFRGVAAGDGKSAARSWDALRASFGTDNRAEPLRGVATRGGRRSTTSNRRGDSIT